MTKRRTSIITTDTEIDAAIMQVDVYDGYRPKAVSVMYRKEDDAVTMTLVSGIAITIPRKLLQGLENATLAQLHNVQVVGAQSGLH